MDKQKALNKITQMVSMYQTLLDRNNDPTIYVEALVEASRILEIGLINDIANTLCILKREALAEKNYGILTFQNLMKNYNQDYLNAVSIRIYRIKQSSNLTKPILQSSRPIMNYKLKYICSYYLTSVINLL